MLKFIDDSEFDLLDSVTCDGDGVYHWTYDDGDANHSGSVVVGFKRTIQEKTGTEQIQVGETEPTYDDEGELVTPSEPIFEEQPVFTDVEVDIYAKFVAKEAANEITVTRKSQQEIDAEAKEAQRKALQRQRNEALAALVHDFEDGRVMQVRPDDMPVIQAQIALGTDRKWVMLDDTTAIVTVTEMQTALASGMSQFQVIWDDYMTALEALNAS